MGNMSTIISHVIENGITKVVGGRIVVYEKDRVDSENHRRPRARFESHAQKTLSLKNCKNLTATLTPTMDATITMLAPNHWLTVLT